jgi:hypothetical protein
MCIEAHAKINRSDFSRWRTPSDLRFKTLLHRSACINYKISSSTLSNPIYKNLHMLSTWTLFRNWQCQKSKKIIKRINMNCGQNKWELGPTCAIGWSQYARGRRNTNINDAAIERLKSKHRLSAQLGKDVSMGTSEIQGHIEMVVQTSNAFYTNALENAHNCTKCIWTVVTPSVILASPINGNLY